jgi:hypothetical protein
MAHGITLGRFAEEHRANIFREGVSRAVGRAHKGKEPEIRSLATAALAYRLGSLGGEASQEKGEQREELWTVC